MNVKNLFRFDVVGNILLIAFFVFIGYTMFSKVPTSEVYSDVLEIVEQEKVKPGSIVNYKVKYCKESSQEVEVVLTLVPEENTNLKVYLGQKPQTFPLTSTGCNESNPGLVQVPVELPGDIEEGKYTIKVDTIRSQGPFRDPKVISYTTEVFEVGY